MLRMQANVNTYGPDADGYVTRGDFDRFIPDQVGCTVRSLDYRGFGPDPRHDFDSRALGAKPRSSEDDIEGKFR